MLTYLQIHLYFLIPPILFLGAIYSPVLGRRELLKIWWLILMATLSATPWDNFILSYSGWTYPPSAIIGRIALIPIEEHMFFALQPIFVLLIHFIVTHSRLLSFDLPHIATIAPLRPGQEDAADEDGELMSNCNGNGHGGIDKSTLVEDDHQSQLPLPHIQPMTVQTLPRRPLTASLWSITFFLGLYLVLEAHGICSALQLGSQAFYLGWILVWIIPVIVFLTYLGGRLTNTDYVALGLSVGWLWMIDTIAIRSGTWSVAPATSLRWEIWRGLPFEEFIFFFLTTYLLILASSLISHLHTILVLCPEYPPCPPLALIKHINLLARVAFHPPEIDFRVLQGLQQAENTLRMGSKSFQVAKLAFGREMRLGLVVIYAWCRVTDNLIDEPVLDSTLINPTNAQLSSIRHHILKTIRNHLLESYKYNSKHKYPATQYPPYTLDEILDDIPHLRPSDRSAFHLFASLIPRLVPIYPFLELCDGYETDMQFSSSSKPLLKQCQHQDIDRYLPIKTSDDLLEYADNVAGSIASAICYLSWSILTQPISSSTHRGADESRPVDQYNFAAALHGRKQEDPKTKVVRKKESQGFGFEFVSTTMTEGIIIPTILSAREMGRALQLVNISRDIVKDALISRLYIPLSSFPNAQSLLSVLSPSPASSSSSSSSYAPFTLPLLDQADEMRLRSQNAIGNLPRSSRGGTRAMIASYFEIANAIRDNKGQVDERGVKVSKWTRARKALWAMWF